MTWWTIGNIKVTRIGESVGPAGSQADTFLTGFDREKFERHLPWMVPNHYDPPTGKLVTSIHTWLIRSGKLTILIDTCSGNGRNRPHHPRFHQLNTPYLERLRAAGVEPEEVDIVMCTHLHSDHCGWNTQRRDGRWVPTFPNARYLFSKTEGERWNPEKGGNPERAEMYVDSVLPVLESGKAVLLDGAHDIDGSLHIEPAPGHTPGHILLRATDGRHRGLFCGDAIHHPVQVFEPEWNSRFCEDPDVARATRRRILEECADHGALLFPTHFAPPHVAAIFRFGDGFIPAFVPGFGKDL